MTSGQVEQEAKMATLGSPGVEKDQQGDHGDALAAVVDAHLHIWSSELGAYAEGKAPPASLGDDVASFAAFDKVMATHRVSRCVIVQPINYLYDHEPVSKVLREHSDRCRGVLLVDPSRGPEQLDAVLAMAPPGAWSGVRLNPGLWQAAGGASIAGDNGQAIFKRCGELGLAATFMFFGGIAAHEADLRILAESFPATAIVIDHLGFVREDPQLPAAAQAFRSESAAALLRLAALPQIHVKLSALFRIATVAAAVVGGEEAGGGGDEGGGGGGGGSGSGGSSLFGASPLLSKADQDQAPDEAAGFAQRVLDAYGTKRLVFGSDFPYVQLESNGGYAATLRAVTAFARRQAAPTAVADILGGNAHRLFFLRSPAKKAS